MRIRNAALKGVCHEMEILCRPLKVDQYFLYVRWWFLNFLASLLLRKSTNDREGSQCINYDPAYGAFFRISKCLQRSKQKLCNFFSLEHGRLKI